MLGLNSWISFTCGTKSRAARCAGPAVTAHQIKNTMLMQSAQNISNEKYLAADNFFPPSFFLFGNVLSAFI